MTLCQASEGLWRPRQPGQDGRESQGRTRTGSTERVSGEASFLLDRGHKWGPNQMDISLLVLLSGGPDKNQNRPVDRGVVTSARTGRR